MNTENQPLKIIGNESNTVYEIVPDGKTPTPQPPAAAEDGNAVGGPATEKWEAPTPQSSNDLATNDGNVIGTLDTTFHHRPGLTKGENPSGSDRADYYEERSFGKSDAEEEAASSPNE